MVLADQTNNRVTSIPGIPQRNGIEEQIQQSALTGIYPGVIPEIKVVDVPNSNKVVVIVGVDESVQAPHAIQNSTRVYIRTGSITEPYELSDMGRISHMLKRREDSEIVAQQILNQIEERISNVVPITKTIGDTLYHIRDFPTFTVIARPVFPYCPVISVSSIYKLHESFISPPKRVAGGSVHFDDEVYWELNEYGIVYHRVVLPIPLEQGIDLEQDIDYGILLSHLNSLLNPANTLYVDCAYQGNIKVTARLQNVFGKKLIDTAGYGYGKITVNLHGKPICSDQKVLASKHCLARYLAGEKEREDIIEELTYQLLWAFNIPIDNPDVRENVRKRIKREFHK